MAALADFFNAYSHLIFTAGINTALALSVYITLMAGQLAMSSMGFMAIGAYTSALLALKEGIPFPWSLLLAALLAGAVSLVIGTPVLRLKGVYLAITTVGFGEIIRFTALNWSYGGGAMGLNGIPQATTIWHVLAYLSLLVYFFHLLERSRFGRALRAIGRDEAVAKTMGIPTTAYKGMAFAIGAVMAAVAGSLVAHQTFYISPGEFSFAQAVLVLLYAVFGGLKSYWGPILGAWVLTLLPEVFRFLQDWRLILYGLSVLAVVVFFPDGLLEMLQVLQRKGGQWLQPGRAGAAPTERGLGR